MTNARAHTLQHARTHTGCPDRIHFLCITGVRDRVEVKIVVIDPDIFRL